MIRSALPAALLLLGGCAARDEGAFPSLGIRPVESRSDAVTTPPVSPPAPADAALTGRLDELRRAIAEGQRAFDQAFPAAERTITAGHGVAAGTERWVIAQTALSALESTRAEASAALSGIDTLLADRIAAGETAGTTELLALREEAAAVVETQATRLTPLRSGLAG